MKTKTVRAWAVVNGEGDLMQVNDAKPNAIAISELYNMRHRFGEYHAVPCTITYSVKGKVEK